MQAEVPKHSERTEEKTEEMGFSVLFTSLSGYLCDMAIGKYSLSRTNLSSHLETPLQ